MNLPDGALALIAPVQYVPASSLCVRTFLLDSQVLLILCCIPPSTLEPHYPPTHRLYGHGKIFGTGSATMEVQKDNDRKGSAASGQFGGRRRSTVAEYAVTSVLTNNEVPIFDRELTADEQVLAALGYKYGP